MPKRGDIYWADIPEAVGHEQQGDRPWLIVSADFIPNQYDIVIAIPLTSRHKANQQHRIGIPDSEKIDEPGTKGWKGYSVALTEQIRILDMSRFGLNPVKVGHVKSLGMNMVDAGILYVLGIPP